MLPSEQGGEAARGHGEAEESELEDRSPRRDRAKFQFRRLVVEDEGEEEAGEQPAEPLQRGSGWRVDLRLIVGKGLSEPVQAKMFPEFLPMTRDS